MADALHPDQVAKIRAALANEGALEALALYRQFTGAPLPQAKAFIDGLAAASPSTPEAAPRALTAGESAEVRTLLADGDAIGAVRFYRAATGASMPESRDFVAAVRAAAAERDVPQDLLDLTARFLSGVGEMTEVRARFARERAARPEDEMLAAVSRAQRLLDLAYDLADAIRDGKGDGPAALPRLRRDCPGFSDDAYRSALDYGFFASR